MVVIDDGSNESLLCLDDLRDAGVDAKLVRSLEATMLSKGLDPERPEDVQAMFVHMIDTVYPRLMN